MRSHSLKNAGTLKKSPNGLFTGHGAPTDALGGLGATYYDLDAGLFYGPRDVDTWGVRGSVSVRGTSATAAGGYGGADSVLTVPAATQPGDLILIWASQGGFSSTWPATPAGYTLLQNVGNGHLGGALFLKEATSADAGASVAVHSNNGMGCTTVCIVLANGDKNAITIGSINYSPDVASSLATLGVTPQYANSAIVSLWANNNYACSTVDAACTSTVIGPAVAGGGGCGGNSAGVEIRSTATAAPARTSTYSGSHYMFALAVAVAPKQAIATFMGAPDASATQKGLLQLGGDLAGTAAAPTVPGKAPLQEAVNAVAASGAAQTLPDVTTATIHRVVLSANCTFTFPTAAAGKSFTLVLAQDATGSRTATWPGTVKWPGGVAPTLTTTANKVDVLSFVCADGTNWLGFVSGQNF